MGQGELLGGTYDAPCATHKYGDEDGVYTASEVYPWNRSQHYIANYLVIRPVSSILPISRHNVDVGNAALTN